MEQILIDAGDIFFSIAKIGFLFGLTLYIVFAVVIIKQVNLMTDTLELGHEGVIKNLSIAHLVFSVGVFLLAIVIL